MDFVDTYETQSNIGKYAQQYLGKTPADKSRAVVFLNESGGEDTDAVVKLTAVASNDGKTLAYWYAEGASDDKPTSIKADDVPAYARRAMKVVDAWRDYLPYDSKTTYAMFYDEDGNLRAKYHVMTLLQQYLWPVAGKRPNWIGIAVDAAILLVLLMIVAGAVHAIRRRRAVRISSSAFAVPSPTPLSAQ